MKVLEASVTKEGNLNLKLRTKEGHIVEIYEASVGLMRTHEEMWTKALSVDVSVASSHPLNNITERPVLEVTFEELEKMLGKKLKIVGDTK